MGLGHLARRAASGRSRRSSASCSRSCRCRSCGGWRAQKRRVGTALGSRALTADAFQTDACFWLSLFLLVGIGANALFGWWWADPLAALGMTFFIGREALEAWRGEDDD